MAETLSVNSMIPNQFEPKKKHQWVFLIEGIDAFLMKQAARPTIETQTKKFIGSIQRATLPVKQRSPIQALHSMIQLHLLVHNR